MSKALSTDILIVGGGIAGLWLAARLKAAGYSALLVETGSLGGGQSLKSQGIIHGGIKYALQGALTGASQAIADMPRRWRACLDGVGELDLQPVRVLSDAHYLWSPGSLAGNLSSFFASKAVRGRVEAVHGSALPLPLQHPRFKGRVYRLSELVLDVPSLIAHLASLNQGRLLKASSLQPLLENNQLVGLQADDYAIVAQRIVLCAGAGNSALLAQLGVREPEQQLRPLHMVLAKGAALQPLYAHCMGSGSKPRITVTSHPASDGQWVWYLGGDLAEAKGVARNEQEQIKAAARELKSLLPWLDQPALIWATLRVDRAEPAQSSRARPDNAFLHEQGRLMVAWPTKLALSPDLADRVLTQLQRDGVTPGAHQPLPELPVPELGQTPWQRMS